MRAIDAFKGSENRPIFAPAPAETAHARDRMMRGFTLMEILAALAVSTIAVLLTQPVIAAGMLDVRRSTTINGLIRSLHFARRSAAERGRDTVLCASADGWRCSGGDWSSGWIVHDDPSRTGAYAPVARSVLHRSRSGNGVAISANRTQFVFRPFRGRSTNGTLVLCDRRGSSEARAVIVSNLGRPRLASTTSSGGPLDC